MKNTKMIKTIIILCFIVLFILTAILTGIVRKEKKKSLNEKAQNQVVMQDLENAVYDDSVKYNNIKSVLESYGCTFISETKKPKEIIYLEFGKNLYESNGTSNQNYFESLINACAKKLSKTIFYLYDEQKSIQITVECDLVNSEITYKINNIANYFSNSDSDLFKEAETTEIVKYQSIEKTYNILYNLINNNMFLTNEFGDEEGKTEDGKYGYYLNKTVKAYISAGKVRNLIFTSAYEGDVFNNISVGTPLKQVAEQLPDYAFGSVNDGFLGYRTKDVYVFIYEDEISVYGYSYSEHPEFEEYIKTYLTNFDLEKFVSNVTSLWQSYDEFEYDKENQSLHLTYPYIGVMIDIEDNVASGITLYSNYCFTDISKRLVAQGDVSINSKEDAIYKVEMKRKFSENN